MTKINTNIDDLLLKGLNKTIAKKTFNLIIKKNKIFSNDKYNSNLSHMFNYAFLQDSSLFPKIKIEENQSIECSFKEYIVDWCTKYYKDRNNPALKRPLKNYGEKDPALIERVAANTQETQNTLNNFLTGHFIYMSAENMNGSILEEYLATVLEPHCWIWCAGATFKAIDFCYLKPHKEILLQVKNKYNTENSSSSAIRNGTEIKKWYRLQKPKSKTGFDTPIPNWKELVNIISASNEEFSKLLTEENYLKYIKENSTTEIKEL